MNADTLSIAVVSVGTGIITTAFYLTMYLRPDMVWAINAPSSLQPGWHKLEIRRARWYHVAFCIVAAIGTGICVKSALIDLLMWMPKSWELNEMWMAESFAGMAGVTAGFFLPAGAIQMSSDLGQSRQEVERLTAAIIELEKTHR